MNRFLTLAAAVVVCSCIWAQKAPQSSIPKTPPVKTAPGGPPATTRYCSTDAGFCLSYPRAWKRLSEIEGVGLVVAQPKPGVSEAMWPQVTASAVSLPEAPAGKEPTSFEDVVNVVLESLGPGAEKQTLSRTALTLNGLAAERAKVQYKDAEGNTWLEDVVFIDGDEVIFSVSLRCKPEELKSLLPAYEQLLRSWKVSNETR